MKKTEAWRFEGRIKRGEEAEGRIVPIVNGDLQEV
jgi:hypothetical protein